MVLFACHVHFSLLTVPRKGPSSQLLSISGLDTLTSLSHTLINSKYHRDTMLAAKAFCETMENPTATIQCHISTEREKRIKENRKLLQLIGKAVLYCERQCIALRGDKERLYQPVNPGNFRALLKLISEGNDVRAQHLRNANRVTYISPRPKTR